MHCAASVNLGSLLSLNAPCFVVYFEVCSVIWPLYAKGRFGALAGLALSEGFSSSLSHRMPVAQHQSG